MLLLRFIFVSEWFSEAFGFAGVAAAATSLLGRDQDAAARQVKVIKPLTYTCEIPVRFYKRRLLTLRVVAAGVP